MFDLLRAAVWELPELPLTSPKSSTALWRERCGCCLFSVSLFLPPSRCFSFLSPPSFCLRRAWRSAALPQHCWGAATGGAGGAVPCAPAGVPGAGAADNSRVRYLFATVMKLQAPVTEPALSVCPLRFFLLLYFFSVKIRTGLQNYSRLSHLFF